MAYPLPFDTKVKNFFRLYFIFIKNHYICSANTSNNRNITPIIRRVKKFEGLFYSLVGTTNVVKIFGSANLFLHISKRFYIFADVGKG